MDTPHTPPAPPHEEHKEVSPKDSFVLGLGFAWDLGYTIAVPAVVLGLGGAYLDENVFDTSPLFLLAGLLLAFVISFSVIAGKIRTINRRMPKDMPKKKEVVLENPENLEQQALHDLFRPPKK
ncbi:hypothetical protein A2881_05610 [Candidatus Peribacteria bacterium RIFCSPHIGHO2_01_FULL_55_13]|nr:MAG: hypothetical protein A2881_05610 [Candidatus Peribacteria bacterium RIFCSPHIGHO2_01_FULL_55_13]OGJ64755.1 MAG: hypothetical protein A3F36_05405 [Candidatus Peribacteria bacterium RIFCSPHIGHO2_12_FULL_55_11]